MMAKEPIKTETITSEVTPEVVVVEPAPAAVIDGGLSAQTKAEMEAGRQALKAYQDTIRSRQAD